ncbi:MAG: alpha/beta fold hydrolase [Ignavibacteria bacterium]
MYNIRILLSIIVSFTIISSAVSQQKISKRFDSPAVHKRFQRGDKPTAQTDFTLTMTDGTIIDCTQFTATGTPPSGGWPAMVFCHGFGGNKDEVMTDADDLSSNGYFTICYSMRGQGESTGLTNLISTTEMNDFVAIVNYVKAQSGINANKVGAIGASQGGTIPLMASCNYPGLLRCVISDVGTPELGTDWITNNSVKMSLLWSLSYDNTIARYNNQVTAYRNWILEDTPAKMDSLNFYMPLNRVYYNKIVQNTTPVFVSTVWQDKFFSTYPYLRNIYSFANPYRFYMGTFDAHGADANTNEGNFHDDGITNWMDYYLGGVANGAPDSVRFTYASSSYPRGTSGWTWRRFNTNTWPPAGVNDVKFYLHPNGVINNKVHTTLPDTVNLLNNVIDPTLTMTEAVNYEFTGTVFNTKFGKTQLTFETNPLAADARMIGTPYINLHYIPSTNIAQFNVQFYEIKAGTTPFLIGRANYTDRKLTPGALKQLAFFGTSFSHIFQAGSKIRVVITNLDNIAADPFLRTNPFVLPSLKRANNRIYTNATNPSYVQLPLINYIDVNVNPISSEVPSSIELFQNYPNPFNPVTNIKFSIPEKYSGSNVKLTVYDIKGQEIKTLINENLSAGVYQSRFDGISLSSGVYFYTLTVKDFKETKRLLLVK